MDAYTAALVRHLEEVAPQAAAHVGDTVSIGGGTRTDLGAARLKTILTAIRKREHLHSCIRHDIVDSRSRDITSFNRGQTSFEGINRYNDIHKIKDLL